MRLWRERDIKLDDRRQIGSIEWVCRGSESFDSEFPPKLCSFRQNEIKKKREGVHEGAKEKFFFFSLIVSFGDK